MSDFNYQDREPLLEMYLFESAQLIEQLEDHLMLIEQDGQVTSQTVNEIFRIMHTIKGSSAMMSFDEIAGLTHSIEDLFDTIRNQPDLDFNVSVLTDQLLKAVDYLKGQLNLISVKEEPEAVPEQLLQAIKHLHQDMLQPDRETESDNLQKHYYSCEIKFQKDCEMENLRAYGVVHGLEPHAIELFHHPADLIESEEKSSVEIRENGFKLVFVTLLEYKSIFELLDQTLFLDTLSLDEITPADFKRLSGQDICTGQIEDQPARESDSPAGKISDQLPMLNVQSLISVNIDKLDYLMDLVGELVISEAMVTHNPELADLDLDQFHKAARQLRKLTNELQDTVMSMRMVPVATTFHKMQRIVRDMNKKLGKQVSLQLAGEQTEVDKSVVDRLADPLMHLIRNALDHGIESKSERIEAGKPEQGVIRLEARNAGSDVWISVTDDGRGLSRQVILEKAKKRGLLAKPEAEMSDKDVYALILAPGFSTRDTVSEFSGRGVGMDVVRENINRVGGTIQIDSSYGQGTSITIRIPLTLAIIDGMLIRAGDNTYIIPITAIRESFRPTPDQIIIDSENNEMIMIRGHCTYIQRLHQKFALKGASDVLSEGILIVVEDDDNTVCLFADELVGEQQVVVKPLPHYFKQVRGVAGCTILGDGRISLILDIAGLMS